jgi:hypothetical protein
MTKEATIPFGDANRTEENWQADVYRRLSRILSQPGGEKALTASMVAAAKEARRSRHATAPGRIPTDDKAGEEIETEPETKHNMAALPQRGKNKKPYWKYRVALKHLIPGGGSYRAIKASMDALANALAGEPRFREFDISRFRHIPRGNKAFDYLDYANNLLTEMYEYADAKRIWID